jgi:hypothetical protein
MVTETAAAHLADGNRNGCGLCGGKRLSFPVQVVTIQPLSQPCVGAITITSFIVR